MELGGKDHIEQAIRDYNATKDLVGPGQQRDIKREYVVHCNPCSSENERPLKRLCRNANDRSAVTDYA